MGTAVALILLALGPAGCVRPGVVESTAGGQPALARRIVLAGVRQTRPGVGVPGRLDHLAYDAGTSRLFVAALENGSLEVVDLAAGRRVRSIGDLHLPQGVAVVPAHHSIAVACGGDGTLHVFDSRSLEEGHTLYVGPDADNVRYDAGSDTLWVAYGGATSGAIAGYGPRAWNRLCEIPFGSHPESFQLEPNGARLFANLPKGVRAVEDGSVAVAGRRNCQIQTVIPLAGRARNFPLAFDAGCQRLFIASRRPARLIVIDTQRGAIIAEAPCIDDSDDLFYDARTGRVLVIGGGFRPDLQEPGTASPCSPPGEMGALEVFAVSRSGQLTHLSTTPTAPHARTGLLVPSRHAIYIAVPFRGDTEAEIREYRLD